MQRAHIHLREKHQHRQGKIRRRLNQICNLESPINNLKSAPLALQDLVGIHMSKQLIRSATSPAANYAEARGAESRRDFLHKMQISLKELRETSVWLRFLARIHPRISQSKRLAQESNELISIFVKSINTAKARSTAG